MYACSKALFEIRDYRRTHKKAADLCTGAKKGEEGERADWRWDVREKGSCRVTQDRIVVKSNDSVERERRRSALANEAMNSQKPDNGDC